MKNTRILYIINEITFGGTEKQLVKLINGLNEKNCYNISLCCYKKNKKQIILDNVDLYEFPFYSYYNPLFLKEFIRLILYCKKKKIEIVHTFFQDPTIIGALLKLFLPIKLVISFRDLGFWKTPILLIKMRIAYLFGDVFLSNSIAVKNYYIENDRIPEYKSFVIYNGVAIPENEKIKTIKYDEKKIVGIAANFNRKVKRVDDFIKIAAVVYEKYTSVQFIIIGDGKFKNDLLKLTSRLGISENVIFTGRINDPQKYIKKFSVGVLTSESEGLSNAILEYMANGVPVVATNVGGNPELVENGINGFLVKVGDFEGFAEKVLYLLNNPEKLREIGRKNIEKVKNNFSIDKMVVEHQKIYNNLLKGD